MSELNDDVTTTPEITSETSPVEQNPTLATETAEPVEVTTNAPEPTAMDENNTIEATTTEPVAATTIETNNNLSDAIDHIEISDE
jgi:hypothetical protein